MDNQCLRNALSLRQVVTSKPEYEVLDSIAKEKTMQKLSETILYLKNLQKIVAVSTKALIYGIESNYKQVLQSISIQKKKFQSLYAWSSTVLKLEKQDKVFLDGFSPDMNSLIDWHEQKLDSIQKSINDYYNSDIFNITLSPKKAIYSQNPINMILGIESQGPRIASSICNPPELVSLSTGSYRLEDKTYLYYSTWHKKDLGDVYLYKTDTNEKIPLLAPQTSSEPELVFCILGSKRYTETYLSNECNLCKRAVKEFYQCSFCQSEVCKKCTEWVFNSKLSDSGLKCFNNHPLRVFENAGEFYMDIRANKDRKFLCDGCKKRKSNKSHHCRKCLVDYCDDCVEMIISSIQHFTNLESSRPVGTTSVFMFKSTCRKDLLWKYNKSKYKCKRCSKKFSKTGAFECKDCDLVLCIGCATECIGRKGNLRF
jgi:hypothetical protein